MMYNKEEESYRIMETIEEKQEFMKFYFWHIGDGNFVRALNRFKNKEGFGIESVGILFHLDFQEWEEYRCKEDEVALILDYPAAEEDTIGYLDFKQFYGYLKDHSQEYIRKHPEQKEEVVKLLKEIKQSLNINE
jgi:hypothetical protein